MKNAFEKRQEYNTRLIRHHLEKSNFDFEISRLSKEILLKPYLNYNETRLNEIITSMDKEIIELEKEKRKYEESGKYFVRELEELKAKKPHKYINYRNIIDNIISDIQKIEAKLNKNYFLNIKNLVDKTIDGNHLLEDQKIYYEAVSIFLAQKVIMIRHGESAYKVNKIDMIKRRVETEGGKIIKFDNLGTGQGQSTYLSGLLSTNDNRKMIVLFDEVAMMDAASLKPIFDRLKSLYKEKKLLCGIVVQKANSEKVESLI